MIKSKNLFWPLCLTSAILFQGLFYNLNAGINYLIYTVFILCVLFVYHNPTKYSPIYLFLLFLSILSMMAVIFANTSYSVFIYWIITICFISVGGYSQIRHIQLIPALTIRNLGDHMSTEADIEKSEASSKVGSFLKFIFLPLITIAILLWLYAASNELFAKSISWLTKSLATFFKNFSPALIVFSVFGYLILALFLKIKADSEFIERDQSISNQLVRVKKRLHQSMGLTRLLFRKKQVAIAAFFVLNVMLFWLNFLDITHVWFNFNWNGGFLKDMIHDGTNTLIFAILISIGITLFYLRSNLVFMKNNQLFYGLLLLWLIQNIIMSVSVAIRNTIYIEHFALAYKRIFVYFFLMACLIGLLSIIYKIIMKRSIAYLISVNIFSVMLILCVSACFNWDAIIARYNFKNYKNSYVHYKYLITLNNSALPWLIKSENELNEIYSYQTRKFPFVTKKEYENRDFRNQIEDRRVSFLKNWEKKSVLEWNYQEYNAYILLKK